MHLLRKLLALGLLISAGLIGSFWYQVRQTAQPTEWNETPSADSSISVPKPDPLTRADETHLAQLSTSLERPLFAPNRRPPAPKAPEEIGKALEIAAQAPVTSTDLPKLTLSAILSVGQEKSALLQAANKPEPTRVFEGDNYAGWVLKEILDNSVIVLSGKTESKLMLREYSGPKPQAIARVKAAKPKTQPGRPRPSIFRSSRNPNKP